MTRPLFYSFSAPQRLCAEKRKKTWLAQRRMDAETKIFS